MRTTRYRKPLALLSSTVAIGGLLAAAAAAPAAAAERPGAVGQPIKDRYIVVLDKDASKADLQSTIRGALKAGGRKHHEYTAALTGFAATLPAKAVEALRKDDRVAFVEQDRVVTLDTTQSPATWGLDRIDQRNLPLNNSYTYNYTGAGVRAYIIDTGMRLAHNEFTGRVTSGYDAIDGGTADDCNGHGTHVAGTVGGTTFGVAKQVQLVAVRVLNCQGSGTNSQVIAGINWVTTDHDPGERAVANMSLGGGASAAIDQAVTNSINDGVTYAVAAGNGDALGNPQNACNFSPARVANAITVSATSNTDTKASWANYGTCLDIFAPGVSIMSAWSTSNTATNTISGTSMATPHLAGAAALYLQQNSSATPQQVRDQLVNTSTTGVVRSPGTGSPNRLLYTLGGTAPPPPPPSSCAGYPQVYTGSLSGSGDYDNQPNGTYYQSTTSGTHKGCLDGPAGVDFDLYLYRWNGYYWATVASGTSSAPDEVVTYSGTPGYYLWEVYSYSGSGSYTFGLQRP